MKVTIIDLWVYLCIYFCYIVSYIKRPIPPKGTRLISIFKTRFGGPGGQAILLVFGRVIVRV